MNLPFLNCFHPRYYAIAKPLKLKRMSSVQRTLQMVIILWIISVGLGIFEAAGTVSGLDITI